MVVLNIFCDSERDAGGWVGGSKMAISVRRNY